MKNEQKLKHLQVLQEFRGMIESSKPGTLLPSIRKLMNQFCVSQNVIDKALQVLVDEGLIRKKRGSGIYVEGDRRQNKVIGLYTDDEANHNAGRIFVQGLRAGVREQGFQVVDFGPDDNQDPIETLNIARDLKVSGLVVYLSSINFFRFEGDPHFFRWIQESHLPVVTSRPLPIVQADSVTTDYYYSYYQLARYLSQKNVKSTFYIGHTGVSSMARLNGFKAGLDKQIPCNYRILYRVEESFEEAIREIEDIKYDGCLVLGAPSDFSGKVRFGLQELDQLHCQKIALAIEKNHLLHQDERYLRIERPSFQMGKRAASLILKRIKGYKGKPVHEVIPHQLNFVS